MNISQMRNLKKQGGFTLIELMIVIAILAILLAIAIPAYQDYTVRSQISECIYAAAPAKLTVSETATSEGVLPQNLTTAQINWVDPGASDHCNGVTIAASGVITADVSAGDAGNLIFTPNQANLRAPITWTCTNSGFTNLNQIPAECRGT